MMQERGHRLDDGLRRQQIASLGLMGIGVILALASVLGAMTAQGPEDALNIIVLLALGAGLSCLGWSLPTSKPSNASTKANTRRT